MDPYDDPLEDDDEDAWDEGALDEGAESMTFLVFGGEEQRPALELYAAFRRPATEADRRAEEEARRDGFFEAELLDELREPVAGGGRLLLAGLGGEEDRLFAAPTTTGAVAHAVLPNGGGGCDDPGPDGLVLAGLTLPGSFAVLGLVADAVERVDVLVRGERRPAQMGENAFGLRVDDVSASALEGLALHRTDGTVAEIEIPRLPPDGGAD